MSNFKIFKIPRIQISPISLNLCRTLFFITSKRVGLHVIWKRLMKGLPFTFPVHFQTTLYLSYYLRYWNFSSISAFIRVIFDPFFDAPFLGYEKNQKIFKIEISPISFNLGRRLFSITSKRVELHVIWKRLLKGLTFTFPMHF